MSARVPLLIVLATSLAAEPVPPALPPAKNQESEAQTITKCLVDLKSDEAQVRLKAVLLVGKYKRSPAAVSAVIQCLSDSSTAVRQAALVALTEERPPAQADFPIIDRLQDEEVSIRRIAASQAAVVYRRFRVNTRDAKSERLAVAEQRILQAFRDDDLLVRRSMYHSFAKFSPPAGQAEVSLGLAAKDREIRALAVGQGFRLPSARMVEELGQLVQDPDVRIRRELARTTAHLPAAIPMLRILSEDDDLETRSRSLLARFNAGEKDLQADLFALLEDPQMPRDVSRAFVRRLAQNPSGAEMLAHLLTNRQAALRELAVQAKFSRMKKPPAADLVPILQDSAISVRRAVAPYAFQAEWQAEDIASLLSSEYTDTREMATRLAGRLPNSLAQPLLEEALFDDHDQVRKRAIESIVLKRIPGWELVAQDTIETNDLGMRQWTVQFLGSRPDSKAFVLDVARQMENSADAAAVRALLPKPRAPTRAVPAQRRAVIRVQP